MKDLFASKKFMVSMAGVFVVLLRKLTTIDIDDETMYQILGLFAVYVIGQGVADVGKEAEVVRQNGNSNGTSTATGR